MKYVALVVLLFGCASARGHRYYDGGDTTISMKADSVRIHIENHRTNDATDPHITLVGTGSHSLGVIQGMTGKIDRMIDVRWLGPSGCVTLRAHFPSGGDLVFTQACWHQGEFIEASLDDLFNPNASWSHR